LFQIMMSKKHALSIMAVGIEICLCVSALAVQTVIRCENDYKINRLAVYCKFDTIRILFVPGLIVEVGASKERRADRYWRMTLSQKGGKSITYIGSHAQKFYKQEGDTNINLLDVIKQMTTMSGQLQIINEKEKIVPNDIILLFIILQWAC